MDPVRQIRGLGLTHISTITSPSPRLVLLLLYDSGSSRLALTFIFLLSNFRRAALEGQVGDFD